MSYFCSPEWLLEKHINDSIVFPPPVLDISSQWWHTNHILIKKGSTAKAQKDCKANTCYFYEFKASCTIRDAKSILWHWSYIVGLGNISILPLECNTMMCNTEYCSYFENTANIACALLLHLCKDNRTWIKEQQNKLLFQVHITVSFDTDNVYKL